jgi:hypothetical protein
MPAKMVSDNLFLKGEIWNESMCMIIKETEQLSYKYFM